MKVADVLSNKMPGDGRVNLRAGASIIVAVLVSTVFVGILLVCSTHISMTLTAKQVALSSSSRLEWWH